MKKVCLILAVSVLGFAVSTGAAQAKFPAKPIKLIVYTKPGGAIDVFARKFEAIAKKYTDATFVVINKTGAGGVVAMKDVLASRADGYKLMAVTRSNIGKIVSTGGKIDIDKLTWLAMMVSDPEAIITNRNLPVRTWEDIVADAKAKKGKQLWVGPAAGGNDHIMAMKTWKAAGIKAKWVPYASGGKAMAALLGGHGVVYVGNPQDVIGRPDLMVAIISSEKRLGGRFADVPTFREKGIVGLDNEIMWRGFMVKKGTPEEAIGFYNDLLRKVNNDPEWRKYISRGGANPVFYGEDKFTQIVKKDLKEFAATLKDLGIIK
ncbi:MAG: tripartite tricarboxylate transporter substrate binding protein [Deltaproteobacteria bacterium]|nr:tripartite tricarboxylate transporter substrate binding protein [Deltaproteobacteria bacterium]